MLQKYLYYIIERSKWKNRLFSHFDIIIRHLFISQKYPLRPTVLFADPKQTTGNKVLYEINL